MATGIEIAGLVLGAAPVILAALKAYQHSWKESAYSLLRTESCVKRLISALEIQYYRYLSSFEMLAKAVDPKLRGVPIDETIWTKICQDPQMDDRIQRYLKGYYSPFLDTTQRFETCLKTIASNLLKLRSSTETRGGGFAALLDLEKSAGAWKFTKTARIRFVLGNAEIRRLIDELNSLNPEIRKFIKHRMVIEDLDLRIEKRSQSAELANKLQGRRERANILCSTLSQMRKLGCQISHQVLLHLEHQSPKDKSGGLGHLDIGDTSSIGFTISVPWHLHKLKLREWQNGSVNFHKFETDKHYSVDLCEIGGPFQLHILENGRSWSIESKTSSAVKNFAETISLGQIFASRTKLKPRQVFQLALRLASSILQLSLTQWLPEQWTSQKIHFFHPSGTQQPDMSQPLLVKNFFHDERRLRTVLLGPIDQLFDLGILLLETYLGHTFQNYLTGAQQEYSNESRMARLSLAIAWFENVREELPPSYRKVVACCLKFNFDEFEPVWGSIGLQEALCADIIEPLERDCLIWGD